MKRTLVVALAVLSASAFANIDTQALINFAGGMSNGGDRSALEGTETLFGLGAQLVGTTTNNIVADDFTVGAGGFNLTSIRLYTYQTGATAPSITGANWSIGGAASTSLTTGTPITNGWWNPNPIGAFRTTSTSTTDTTRRIQFVDVDVTDQFLAAGTYWLSWQFVGTLASGPWQPLNPGSMSAFGDNAVQSINGGAFAAVNNAAGANDLPFTLVGQAVPEPGTMIALGLGAAAMIRRRRK